MAGHVRTKEKCPRCGGKFQGEPLRCRQCRTAPRRYYLDLPWQGQKIKIYSGKDSYPLDSYERAYRLLTAIRHEIDNSLFDPRNYVSKDVLSLQFDRYAQAWLARRQKEVDRGHISREYRYKISAYVKNYLAPYFGSRSIRDIYEAHIEDFRDVLPEHLAAKTVANIMATLHKIMADAHRRRDIARMPDFPKIVLSEPVTRWLTREDQDKVLVHVKCSVRRALFIFLMRQGCRPGEARALRWEDVDFKQKIVIIRAAMDKNNYRPYTKERDVRYLPLHPESEDALRLLPRSLSGFVFTKDGKPLRIQLVSDTWKTAATKAGVQATCYQGTRHSLASQAVNQGVPQNLIGKFLGHKDSRSTERYTHLLTDTLKAVWGLEAPGAGPNQAPGLNGKKK